MIWNKMSIQSILSEHSTPPPSQLIYPPYEPASWQAEAFHKSTKHIKALFGGDRSGKTGTVSFEMFSLMRRFPGCLFWFAALTEDKLTAIWEWHKLLFAPGEIKKIEWRKSNRIPLVVSLHDGTVMEYKTWRSGSGSFSANSVKAIHLDEDGQRITAEAEGIFNDCLSRILDNDGYVFVSATPILGKNWMYKRLYMRNKDNREDHTPDPDIECWNVSLLDNKFISDSAKAKQKGRMTKDEIDRRFYGMFTTLSGACFKEFNASVHNLTEEPFISASWRRIRVIDFGYNHPFYCLWMAQDDDGVLWLYDEHHQNETLLAEHARIIYDKTKGHESTLLQDMPKFLTIEATIADHDSQDRAELESGGLGDMAIFTIPAIKSATGTGNKGVDLSIQAVNRHLKLDARHKARLYVSPRCPIAQSQLETYHYKQVRDGSEVKEAVNKIDDEAPDCTRYGVMYFEQGSRNYTVNE